jgi:hypothetical protein
MALSLKPQPGRPRSVFIITRPQRAPLWVEGTRGGRRLRPSDIHVGADGVPARVVPFRFPEPEDVPCHLLRAARWRAGDRGLGGARDWLSGPARRP